jgi:hypothetical protein
LKLLVTAAYLALAVLAATFAHAHSWYSKGCCEDQDCHPVPCSEITRIPDGWTWHNITFEKFKLRESQDAGCHVCVSVAKYGRCIYLPWGS